MSFPESVQVAALAACERCCCICHKFCGLKMELHHIKPKGDGGEDTFENCIPLCFDCHADMGKADPRHPKGKHYTAKELIQHRDNWYDKVKASKTPKEITKEDIENLFADDETIVLDGGNISELSTRKENDKKNTICLNSIKTALEEFAKHLPKISMTDSNENLYVNENDKGTFTFDYSNNNGEYTLGKDEYTFVTKWSKASDTSIHAYKDKLGVNGAIARIKKPNEYPSNLNQEWDFSSRARTAELGDIIIWKNNNGKYAATKVVSIKDDSRGDKHDELTCEYFIFDNQV